MSDKINGIIEELKGLSLLEASQLVKQIEEKTFQIILTEGKNKQIRRMCKTLGFAVERLKRIRIDKFYLSDLELVKYIKIEI